MRGLNAEEGEREREYLEKSLLELLRVWGEKGRECDREGKEVLRHCFFGSKLRMFHGLFLQDVYCIAEMVEMQELVFETRC